MKLTNQEIEYYFNILQQLGQSQIMYPANIAYKIIHNTRELSKYIEDISEIRSKIIKAYYVQDPENKELFKPKEGLREQAETEFKSLMESENEVDIQTFSLSALDGLKLTVADIDSIYFMIED